MNDAAEYFSIFGAYLFQLSILIGKPEGDMYMEQTAMNGDTAALLKKCCAGSKMATNSLEQIQPYVHSEELSELLHNYNAKHIKLGEEIHALLREAGEEDKDPSPMAKAFSWIQSEVKLTMDSSEKEVASILVDGCNMGIKSLSEDLNKYSAASPKAQKLCDDMRKVEKQMTQDLEKYL